MGEARTPTRPLPDHYDQPDEQSLAESPPHGVGLPPRRRGEPPVRPNGYWDDPKQPAEPPVDLYDSQPVPSSDPPGLLPAGHLRDPGDLYVAEAPSPEPSFPQATATLAPPAPPDLAPAPYPTDDLAQPPPLPEAVEARHMAKQPRADPEAESEQAEPGQPKLPYLPGLDGLKAIALIAVLVFSHGVSQLRGGFLAISTAFTLSGFVLATLMLAGWSQRSRLTLSDVWERRARRLVPPLYAVVLLVVLLQVTLRVGAVPTFRGDVWAALGLATNWRLAFPGEGFASSFSELSALSHLWPVAVIAQLAVLLPLAFVGLMAVAGRRWRAAGMLFGLMALASFAAAWLLGSQPQARDLAYYGTHTRAGEVLVGVVLAYALLTPRIRSLLSRPRIVTVVRGGGVVALIALAILWMRVPIDSPGLFRGITMLNALLTAWVILAVSMPGPAPNLLGTWWLRKLGWIGFSTYLFHWPAFLLLDAERTGLDGAPLFGVRLAGSVAAGVVAYWAIERPFRRGLRVPRRTLGAALLSSAAVLALIVLLLPVNPPANISLTVNDGRGPGNLDVVAPAAGGDSASVLVVGDQTAASITDGFRLWNEQDPDAQFRVATHVTGDCPLGGAGTVRRFGTTEDSSLDCEAWRWRLPKMLEATDYDVIVVSMGVADLGEREVDREWRHLGDPAYDRWMADEIGGVADVLSRADVPVLWLTTPHMRLDPSPDDPSTSWSQFDDNDPGRVDRLNALISATARGHSGVELVHLDAWQQDRPGGEFNPEIRVDAGFTDEGAGQLVSWLGPQLLTVAGVETSGEDETDPDQN